MKDTRTHGQRCALAAQRAMAQGFGDIALTFLGQAAREAVALVVKEEGEELAAELVQIELAGLLGLLAVTPAALARN